MITYENARQLVAAHLAEVGEDSLRVASHGYEDSESYRVPVFECGPIFALGGPTYLVDKLNGAVSTVSTIGQLDHLHAMTPTEATFTASGSDWRVYWYTEAPHLAGTRDVIDTIEALLAESDMPAFLTDPAPAGDPEAILAALHVIASPFVLRGDHPSIPPTPESADT